MLSDTFSRIGAELLGYFTAPEQPRGVQERSRPDSQRTRGPRQPEARVVPLAVSPAARAAMLVLAVLLLVALVTVPLAQGLEDRIESVQVQQLGS